MKNLLKKSALASAVAGSLMLSGVASADSLLAPLIMATGGSGAGYDTYLHYKIRGNATPNAGAAGVLTGQTNVNITWLQKGTAPADLYDTTTGCQHTDGSHRASPWDMVYQDVEDSTGGAYHPGDQTRPNFSVPGAGGGGVSGFVGMAILDDAANIAEPKGNDGDFSGFAYIVDYNTGYMYDYKLLNNHHSTDTGNFSAGFISKKAVDFAWGPVDDGVVSAGLATDNSVWSSDTAWLVAVTSADMTNSGGTGSLGNTYDASVRISQNQIAGQDSPRGPLGGSTGAYNNDEKSISGEQNVDVTCMALVGLIPASHVGGIVGNPDNIATGGNLAHDNNPVMEGILTPAQYDNSVNGGWARRSIEPTTTWQPIPGITANRAYTASGAIIYKIETNQTGMGVRAGYPGLRVPAASFQVETSGHLAPGANHVNRPY